MPSPANDWKAWLRPGRSFAELFAADASATPIAPFATLALVLATATALGANRPGLIPPRHLPAVSDAPPAEPGWPLLLHRRRVLAPHHVTFAHTSAEHFRAFVHTDSLSHWAFSSALADVLAAAEPDPGGGLRWPREARWWERGQGPFDVHALALELLARAERHAYGRILLRRPAPTDGADLPRVNGRPILTLNRTLLPANPGHVAIGDAVTVTLTLRAAVPLEDVVVCDAFPANLAFQRHLTRENDAIPAIWASGNKVGYVIHRLPAGVTILRHTLRAIRVGRCAAGPATAFLPAGLRAFAPGAAGDVVAP